MPDTNRTVPEVDRAAAARRAVERRRARASLKRDLTMRVVTPQAMLRRATADPDSVEGSLRITDFLLALPAIGAGKRDRVLEELRISPVKRLGGLGARQRRVLEEWLDGRFPPATPREARSRLLVLAGPTAVGKGTVAAHIRENNPEIHLSVSATTRAPRPGEIDGVHYYFVDDAEFDRLIADGELLEYAVVHNRSRYGTRALRSMRRWPRARRCCSRSTCRAHGRCAPRNPRRRSSSCCPELGRAGAPAGRPRHGGRGGAGAATAHREGRAGRAERVRPLVVNEDVATAAREVVDLSTSSAR